MAVRVAFIDHNAGAGGVNFGGHGNSWDHATRLEKLGDLVEFVGIADINVEQGERALALRKQKPEVANKWSNCKVFGDYKEMLLSARPQCVFIGVPPGAHGSPQQPIERVCAEAGVHMFIEKPISCATPESMQSFTSQFLDKKNLVISVAYMFRYSAAFRKMKELAESFGPIRVIQARYNCAYSKIGAFWFDVSRSGGPIVEQATHFVDLARYFGGDVDLSSVTGMSINATDPLGHLSQLSIDESKLAVENRVPRVTTAMWRFRNGAVGTLNHTVLLHGWNYETEFEIMGDGYQIILRDPYEKCELFCRAPGTEVPEKIAVTRNDAYLEEINTFIEACRTGDTSKIASPYADALKTYELTWAIRRAAASRQQPTAEPTVLPHAVSDNAN